MRRWLALLFLLIFSFQVLPFRAKGKLVGKAQTEEEVKNGAKDDCGDSGDSDCSDDDPFSGKFGEWVDHSLPGLDFHYISRIHKVASYIKDDDVRCSYVGDIISPPPNASHAS